MRSITLTPDSEAVKISGNRLTQYEGAAAAFKALSDATADTLFSAYSNHPSYFTSRPETLSTVDSFREAYAVFLRDFNTAGVVAAHLGRPLTQMEQGYYNIHGTQVKVNASQTKACLAALDKLVGFID